jgi:hypothetical protein
MKANLMIAFCIGLTRVASGADIKLEPDATFRLEFPDLPDTLETLASGEREPVRLTATLPSNYTREGKFPVFVFLDGDKGGRGDGLPIPARMVVPRDFICVALPLFSVRTRRILGHDEDYDCEPCLPVAQPFRCGAEYQSGAPWVFQRWTSRSCSQAMTRYLQHLHVLFVEGGRATCGACPPRACDEKVPLLLLLRGDRADAKPEPKMHRARALEYLAEEHHVDFTSIVMRGYGHELPKEYLSVLGQWARGEKSSEAPTK